MDHSIITLTSDFATTDGYVGAMKGVIRSICPFADLLDISHDIPPQDVGHGAFCLHTAARFFPAGTIHVAVVDPGVGTDRRGICVQAGGHYFVGPDNGLFTPFLEQADAIYSLENNQHWRKTISATFHGRDVFAPVAAHLANGLSPERLGIRVTDPEWIEGWALKNTGDGLESAIIHIDHFGNCITGLTPDDLAGIAPYNLWVPGNSNAPETSVLYKTYGSTELGEACWLEGSTGLVELAVNGGSAAATFGIERGDPVYVEKKS